MYKRILCFGDSNTWGYNAIDESRFDEDTRWTYRLAKLLGDEYIVIEEGLNGRTTCFDDPVEHCKNGSKYLVPCLNTHKPLDLLIIMLGTNDTKQRFGATAYNIAQGVEILVEMASNCDVWRDKPNFLILAPIIIGENYVNTQSVKSIGLGCHEKSVELIPELETVAKNMDCHYMDINNFVSVSPIDCMHIDKNSLQPLSEALYKKVKSIL